MQRYILGRLLQAVICIWGITLIVFILGRLSGDPAMLYAPPDATEQDIIDIQVQLGLDKPLTTQYWIFISKAVQGDLGYSFKWGEPSLSLVLDKIPATLQLTSAALVITLIISLPIGILSAVKRGSIFDTFGRILALLGQSMPTFWAGIMLMLIFAVYFRVLPTSGRGGISHLILPALTLGWYPSAAVMRLTRSGMLDVLDSEYIKMARAKGIPQSMVVLKHGLKNAAIPVVTMLGLQVAHLFSGAVIIETIFGWPGMGRLVIQAISTGDYPVVQAGVLLASMALIFTNLIVDIGYVYLDPRIKYERAK